MTRHLIDFVGYSGDFRYFAFEEYGTLDGSGSAYSSIHILDLWTDKEMPGSPFSAEGREDDKTLAEIRREAGDAAGADLKKLEIDTPVQIAALLGDGIAGAGSEMHFALPVHWRAGLDARRLQTCPRKLLFGADAGLRRRHRRSRQGLRPVGQR